MRRVIVAVWLMLIVLAASPAVTRSAELPRSAKEKAAPAAPAKDQPPKQKPDRPSTQDDVYELQRLLVDTLDQVERNYVRPVDRRKLVEAAIKGALAELDPYSSYIGPDEMNRFRSAVESEFGGIGIRVMVDAGGALRVISTFAGSPAHRAGIIAGDRIVEIEGQSTEHVGVDDAVRRLQGEVGTPVSLSVIHPGQSDKQPVKITREWIHVETVLGDHRNPDGVWNFMLDPEQRIAYVSLTAFSRDTAGELRKVLAALEKEKIRGLVLDLRFNPGGLLNSAVDVCRLFISTGRIVSTAGRNSPERVWEARKEGTFEGFRMAVLVNRYSASASEIVSACLQDHHRAVVVGERTWGKGSVQNVIELEHSDKNVARSVLKLTTAGYRRPNGKNIDRAPGAKAGDEWGVSPDKDLELKLDDAERSALYAVMMDRRDGAMPAPQPQASKPEANTVETAPHPAFKGAKRPSRGPGRGAQPRGPETQPSFVDRQLQLALGYLTSELARAN
jgi:carboxyl-terminal processing protease